MNRLSLLPSRAWALLLVSLAFVAAGYAHAAARYAVANGDWNQSATWAASSGGAPGASVPVAGDTVSIGESATVRVVTIPAGYAAAAASVAIGNAGTNSGGSALTLAGATSSLNVSGNVSLAGANNNNTTNALNAHAGTVSIGGDLTLAAGTGNRRAELNISSGTTSVGGSVAVNNARARITFAGAGRLNVGGDFAGGGTLTSDAGTVAFNGTGNQSIGSYNTAAVNYYHLVIAKTGGSATLAGNIRVRGNFTDNGGFDGVTGNYTVTMAGATAQSLLGTAASTSFYRLTLNNAAGLILTHNLALTNRLTFSSGIVVTGANRVVIASGASLTGAGAAQFVAGTLQMPVATGNNRVVDFAIGSIAGGARYTPSRISMRQVTAAGSLIASTAATEHPNIGSSTLNPALSVNRYWTLANAGVDFIAHSNNSVRFTFDAADVDAGANTDNFDVGRYHAPVWSVTPPPTPTRTATTTAIRGASIIPATIAGEYAIAERQTASGTPGGFNAYETGTAPGSVTGVIKTRIAGAPIAVDVIALDTSRSAILTLFTGTVTVELLNAADNSGVLDTASGCRASWTPIAGASGSLVFAPADNGRKSFSITQNNVWRDVRVRVTYAGPPLTVGCSGDNFAIRPASLSVAVSDNDWQTAGTGRVLNNVVASGGVVHKAGRFFTLTVTPAPAGATNYDGNPVQGTLACTLPAGCVNGTLDLGTFAGTGTRTSDTARYSEAGAYTLTLQDQDYAAVDGADSSPAERYVDSGAVAVGRFVPDHFEVVPLATPAFRTFNATDAMCSTGPAPRRTFTYVGQPFGYATTPQATIIARNASNATTANYRGTLWKIGGSGSAAKSCTTSTCIYTTVFGASGGTVEETYTYTLDTGATPGWDNGAAQTVPAVASVTPNNDGTGTITFTAAGRLAFQRDAGAPLAPFVATINNSIRVTDNAEGALQTISTSTPAAFDAIAFDAPYVDALPANNRANRFYYGRLRLQNANGSELLPLAMRMVTQYYAGSAGFVDNTLDNCTAVPAASIGLANYTLNLNAGETTPSMTGALAAGVKNLTLSAPGAGNSGSVDVVVNLGSTASANTCTTLAPAPAPAGAGLAHLRDLQFCSASRFDRDPTARATFGAYGINRNFIYMRENY